MTIHIQKDVRREMRKKVPVSTDPRHFTLEPDGYEEAEIEVVVDLPRIARELGLKAMGNASGRSRYLDGAVIVSVLRRVRVKG